MIKNELFETYLLISSKKFVISVYQNNKPESLIEKKIELEKKFYLNDLDILKKFLDDNIFKIEKTLNSFIKSIYLIIDLDNFFPIQISVKKSNYNNKLDVETLSYLLNDAKNQCLKTYNGKKIIHMIIENYVLDSEVFSEFPQDKICQDFHIEIKLICFSEKMIKILEEIFKSFQISIKKIIDAKYVKNSFDDKNINMFEMVRKILSGHNLNEIFLVEKTNKNRGFFEKFFNFFN